MKTKNLIMISLVLFIFNSCQKDDLTPLEKNLSDEIALAQPDFSNPLEFAGIVHNDILNAISSDASIFPDYTSSDIYNVGVVVVQNASDALGFPFSAPSADDVAGFVADAPQTKEEFLAIPEQLEADEFINNKQSQALNAIFHQIISSKNATQVVNKMEGYEHSFAQRNDISDTDKKILFMATSIAKHSAPFWEDAQTNSSNPWNIIISGKFWCWLKALLVDVGVGVGVYAATGDEGAGIFVGGAASVESHDNCP